MTMSSPSRSEVTQLLNERVPRPDWTDSDARRRQVVSVAKRTIEADPRSLSHLTEVRNDEQGAVAQELGVRKRTVMDKCGRQIYKEYAHVPDNDYHGAFDEMLWDIYRSLDT